MSTTKPAATIAPAVPMAVAEWRRAILTADVPRNIKIVACQVAHYALTPEAREVVTPTMLTLGEACELPHWAVLDALRALRTAGWITKGRDLRGTRPDRVS